MNNQRYGQQSRPANPAGPTIRAGLSVQELKAMTAMRVAHDHDPSKSGVNTHDASGQFRNPASSYQTATPQQLHAAGIQPLVVNNQPLVRQKSSTLNSFPVYASSTAYPDQHLVGQNRPYNYDDLNAPAAHRNHGGAESGAGTGMSLSSYAKASSTAGAPVPSYSSQQMQSSRGAMPQINSVEDVKEMTRLRMLMSERDAFFDSGASTRGLTSAADTAGTDLDLSESRLGKHFGGSSGASNGGGIPSSSSYDAYDFTPASDDVRAGRGYALSAPAPQAFNIPSSQAPQGYAAAGKTMQQSASLGGLGVRGTTLGHSAAGLTGHSGSYATAPGSNQGLPYMAQGGLAGSTVRGGSHSHLPTGHPSAAAHTTAPLSLSGSSVVGSRRPPSDGRPLIPLTQHPSPSVYGSQGSYSSPYQQSPVDRSDLDLGLGRDPQRRDLGRGIERELMLSSQLPVHGHGLTGGIDRLERALNGHGAQNNHHGLFEEPHSHFPGVRLHNGHQNQEYDHYLGAPQRSLGNIGAIGNLNAPRVEPSLQGLLSTEPVSSYRHDLFHPQDSLFGSPAKAPATGSPLLGAVNGHHSTGLLEPLHLQTHAHKVVLNPLDAHSPTPPLISSARRESPSPVLLAPLTPSPEKEKDKKTSPTAASAGVRKLNMVPKAATFSTVESASTKKVSTPPLRDQSEVAPLSPSTNCPRSEKVTAFGDLSKGLGVKVDGIASPSYDSGDAHTPSPQPRKASIVKAHTTSRLPIDTSASSALLSPKLLIIKNKMSSSSSSSEHTPPPTSGLDRSISDMSGGMNYLASEMAEMVLDTPAHGNKSLSGPQASSHSYTWDDDDRDYLGSVDALLSRDNSNDFGRILGGLSDFSEGSVGNNSGHYKRSNSISYNENE